MNKLDFIIKYDFIENKFFITSKKNFSEIKINIFSFDKERLIYNTIINFEKGVQYWISVNIANERGLLLEVTDNNYFFTEKIKLKTIYDDKIKPIAIHVIKRLGLGDFMWATPLIRKLYTVYNQKITIIGYSEYKEFCKNNPYINEFIDKNDIINFDNYEVFDIFSEIGAPYWQSNMSQLAAKNVGITLKDFELELDYFPDEYVNIFDLPNNYVCINPRIISTDRTWEKEQWQFLIDELNLNNISVVAIGKDDSYKDLVINNGINLVNDERQNNLSQTWHILEKSDIFVSFDTGIYILAGTTNTHIIQLGWTHDPYWHKPVSNKYSHIRGKCDIYCGSDLNIHIDRIGTISLLPNLGGCIKNINYSCKPKAEQVIEEILKILK